MWNWIENTYFCPVDFFLQCQNVFNVEYKISVFLYYPDQFVSVLMENWNCNRCSWLREAIGVFYIFRKYHLQPVFLWCASRRKTHITCQLLTRVQDLSCRLQMSRKIPSRGQETNNIYLWCWQATVSCAEEKICRGSEKIRRSLYSCSTSQKVQHPHENTKDVCLSPNHPSARIWS